MPATYRNRIELELGPSGFTPLPSDVTGLDEIPWVASRLELVAELAGRPVPIVLRRDCGMVWLEHHGACGRLRLTLHHASLTGGPN